MLVLDTVGVKPCSECSRGVLNGPRACGQHRLPLCRARLLICDISCTVVHPLPILEVNIQCLHGSGAPVKRESKCSPTGLHGPHKSSVDVLLYLIDRYTGSRSSGGGRQSCSSRSGNMLLRGQDEENAVRALVDVGIPTCINT